MAGGDVLVTGPGQAVLPDWPARHATELHLLGHVGQESWSKEQRSFKRTGTFTRWVSLLLQTMPETPSPEAVTDFLYLLGEECIQLGQTETLVEIFRKLSGNPTHTKWDARGV